MPLAFRSINRGEIAFGFFNVESDLLLMDQYFLFADAFCDYIILLAAAEEAEEPEFNWSVYFIRDRNKLGDLMGAIYGVRYLGFIGDVYRRFPFPRTQEDFKQNPDGYKNRKVVEELIKGYAEKTEITCSTDAEQEVVKLGELQFTKNVFQELLLYVWVGGAPRWKDGERPPCVMEMKEKAERSKNWLFKGIQF